MESHHHLEFSLILLLRSEDIAVWIWFKTMPLAYYQLAQWYLF